MTGRRPEPPRGGDRSRLAGLAIIGTDLLFALRSLRRAPGFTMLVAGTLAAGMGLAIAVFSAVDHVLLRPLPFAESERLVALREIDPASGDVHDASPALFLGWREHATSLERVAAIEPYGYDLETADGVETIPAWRVSLEFFPLLGVPALHGRALLPRDFDPGAEPVVVLSHRLWQGRFGGDPSVVGRTVVLDRMRTSVVGVMPAAFRFPEGRDLWGPRRFDEADRQEEDAYYTVIARLAPGVTALQADGELARITAQLVRDRPAAARVSARSVPLLDLIVGPLRPMLLLLAGAAAFVLLIACTNVAHLLLVRGLRRRHAYALQGALGASPARLTRQLLLEHVLLALLGGLAGLAVSWWLLEAIALVQPAELLPRTAALTIDGRILIFALAAALLSAVLAGVAPAFRFGRTDLRGTLDTGAWKVGDPAIRRARGGLVAAEVSLAVVLLVGAGLLLRSLIGLAQTEPGFATANRAEVQVFLWDQLEEPAARAEFVRRAVEDLEATAQVTAAGAVSALPYAKAWIDMEGTFTIEGIVGDPDRPPTAYTTVATPGYFGAVGIPIRRGRTFAHADGADAPPVAIVNETMARRYWGNADPLGARIRVGVAESPVVREVVGVVGDVRQGGLDRDPRPELFVPHAQAPFGSMTFVVETAGDPAQLLPLVRQRIQALLPGLPIYHAATLRELLANSVADRRFATVLLTAFAVLAVALACIGVYSVVNFVASERTHEFGIRLALGATAGDLVRITLSGGLRAVVAGVCVGLVAALALTRLLGGLLYGIGATDPVTFASLGALVLALAAVACWIPARRAALVDPLTALRAE